MKRDSSQKPFALTLLVGMLCADLSFARNVYVNGVDISGASGQELKNVDVHINEKGDVYVTAPHYEVHEEDSYLPLSSYLKASPGSASLEHKTPQAIAKPSEEQAVAGRGEEADRAALASGAEKIDASKALPSPPPEPQPVPLSEPASAQAPPAMIDKAGSKAP